MSDIEYDLAYDSPVDCEENAPQNTVITEEDWQDWNSEELLNLWMSVVQYHQDWYLPLRRTFTDFCEFVYHANFESDCDPPQEIQAIKNHPFIKGLDWDLFFSLGTK